MNDTNGHNRRLLRITPGNIRNNHIYVRDHYDFFPSDCVGPSRKRRDGTIQSVELVLDGLNETVSTDIAGSAQTGKPRGFFRGRHWVRRFFQQHQITAGDLLALDYLDTRRYRLSVARRASTAGRSFTAAEFFAGIGLVRLALERNGWQVIFANDIDTDKAEMYRQNWPSDDHLVVQDIHKLRSDDIPTCDLFTASFPCNDLSIAGRWEGLNGKESSAFWGLIEILRNLGARRPPLVMLENVVGFLMSREGRDFEQALMALNELGYCVDAFILNAIHWVPQSRARLFVVATLDCGQERRTTAYPSSARPEALVQFVNLSPHIHWNIEKLPTLPKPRKRLPHIIEELPPDDPHWWNEERATYFMQQLSEKHEVVARHMIKGRRITYATAFRRVRKGRSMAELRSDGIAGCLRTPRGGSGRQILFKAGRGKYQVRLLTARECARLQGVPESYKIDVPLNQALFGFGDAVCVPAVEWIVRHYLTARVSNKLSIVVAPSARAGNDET
ncbi:MAG: DNA (cytosine-5-)-methyltransferase [Planctomycetes bacterium]|nr:DNA (cytosine-5-)-methyltransferase [Planctomycetota bacterium]